VDEYVLTPGWIAEEDLPLVYAAADVFVYPSRYEGFGLPVLEAMACGTPVISSETSALPELGGDAARYFDPYDIEAMAEVIRAVWTDAGLQAEMRRRGIEQAARFSWQRAASETMAVYRALLTR
jgi:glycosyltransferase involved in cell wall biosynthesis